MLHPLEHVGDHQNPLAHTPALTSCQAPQLCCPRFTAKKVSRHPQSPNDGVLPSITLPYLEITGSRYYAHDCGRDAVSAAQPHLFVWIDELIPMSFGASEQARSDGVFAVLGNGQVPKGKDSAVKAKLAGCSFAAFNSEITEQGSELHICLPDFD